MSKIWQEGTKKAVCKNCGKKIYHAKGHDCWYHCNDDNDICNANKPLDFKHIFDKAEPDNNNPQKNPTAEDFQKNGGSNSQTDAIGCGSFVEGTLEEFTEHRIVGHECKGDCPSCKQKQADKEVQE